MRYTIGITMIDKETKDTVEGYYSIGGCGFSAILDESNLKRLKKDNKLNEYWIYVFDNVEDVEYFCRYLSRAYRRDDVWGNDKLKSKKIRRFYPLKIDSSKFNLILDEEFRYGKLKHDIYRYDLKETKNLPKKRVIDFK